MARSISGRAADIELTFECNWTSDKYYVACTQLGDVEGQRIKEVDVYGYSGQAGMYSMLAVLEVGDGVPQVFTNWFEWEGNTWRFVPKNGIRSTWEIKTPDYHVTRTERLDGANWIENATGEHKRIY